MLAGMATQRKTMVDVLERVWARGDLNEEDALKVAYEELDAMRREP
jgi:hypothetical protein